MASTDRHGSRHGDDGRYAETGRSPNDKIVLEAPVARWTRRSEPLGNMGIDSSASTAREFMSAMRDEYEVNASYQRGSVWDVERRQNLIRSLLLGLPAGVIVVAKQDWRTVGPGYRVVDGKQRIEALWAFADSEFGVPADWFGDEDLEVDQIDEDGLVYWNRGLSQRGKRRIHGSMLSKAEFDPYVAMVPVAPGTGNAGPDGSHQRVRRTSAEAEQIEAEMFRLINTGGVEQTAEALARAAAIEAGA